MVESSKVASSSKKHSAPGCRKIDSFFSKKAKLSTTDLDSSNKTSDNENASLPLQLEKDQITEPEPSFSGTSSQNDLLK